RGCRKSNVIPAHAGIWNVINGSWIHDLGHRCTGGNAVKSEAADPTCVDPTPDFRVRGNDDREGIIGPEHPSVPA
ncbi:MAG TPA: hypothetical protein VIY86_09150, partial [Pirellulaceae bacterium]